MDKKKILNILKILFILLFVLFITYNIIQAIICGEQNILVTSGKEYYMDEKIEFSVKVSDATTLDELESKVRVNLLNSNHKKVKNAQETLETKNGEGASFSINIPENTKEGKYYLEIQAQSKKGIDTIEKEIVLKNAYNQNINLQMDKGIYKPGDEINYRVLLTSKKYDEPIEENLEVSIYDGNDNRVYVDKQKTSIYGITSGKFKLADEVNSGSYKIQVATSKINYTKNFVVNPYVTPQFEAKIQTDKDNYLVGEKAKITTNAKYFFGEPVKNAKVSLYINNQKQEGLTDENGDFTFEFTINEKKNIEIKSEIIDDSNYLVEANKVAYVTEDIFDIEILPEYNDIISNLDNDIYFYTKSPNGTAMKTYLTINFNEKISRQVITDENGIGKLSLSSIDINNAKKTSYTSSVNNNSLYNSNTTNYVLPMKISAQDMEGNKLTKDIELKIQKNNNILLKSNKVKYMQGEDITVILNSVTDLKNTTLAICKNGAIIKLITTNETEVTFNLEDNYGIIDIYAINDKSNSIQSSNIKSKRTIFIKPSKKLNIEISTDKDSYQPKENMNLTIGLTNENGNSANGALLVSALDEAVLSIKDNDLTIDNIKLALSDIQISNELDAATMYANIIDDKSESDLMAMLLKQNSKIPNIDKKTYVTYNKEDSAIERILISSIIFVAIIILYCTIKFKKFRQILAHILAFLGIFLILFGILNYLSYEFFYNLEELSCAIISFIITLLLYTTILYKYSVHITRWMWEYIVAFILAFFTFQYLKYGEGIFRWILLIFELTIMPILFGISSLLVNKNIKTNIFKVVKAISKEAIKTEIIMLLTIISALVNPIFAIIVFITANCIYEVKFRKKENDEIEFNINFKMSIQQIIIIIVIAMCILCLLGTMIKIYKNVKSMSSAESIPITNNSTSRRGTMIDPADLSPEYSGSNKSSSQDSSIKGFLSAIEDSISTSKTENSTNNVNAETTQEQTKENKIEVESKQNNVEENVRNVFLESLCFIPELIVENGNVNTDIKLSDNITSWKIQVVGNTLDGKVGYSTKNVTVKKDFFADFTLPSNTVVDDNIQIPVTIYNYTQNELEVVLNVEKEDWFELGDFTPNIKVNSNSTKMEYIPIKIIKEGNNSLKIKATSNNIEDILQKSLVVKNKGVEISSVTSSGAFETRMSQDIIYDVKALEGTKKLKIKLYPSTISQVVEGLENIFRMPTGCFEQVSSSLYPDVMVLKYMEENNLTNDKLKEKAISYISAGYQKLLAYEVKNEKGGYSLYGNSPANTVLTAYGLLELTDLSKVYTIDENVTKNMKEFVYKKQKSNGTFNIVPDSYIDSHVVQTKNDLAINTYIIWALSEVDSNDDRLKKSIKYLEDNLDKMTDNYTIALSANVFANVGDTKNANILVERLLKNTNTQNDKYYLESTISDYYGTRGRVQNIQTTALTSIALTKLGKDPKTNAKLIEYIISSKDSYGTWNSTQATILALRALMAYQTKSDLSNQKVKVTVNNETKEIEISKEPLDIYELVYENLDVENHVDISIEKGRMYYEIIENYYQDTNIYNEMTKNKITVNYTLNTNCKVNEKVVQNIKLKNESENLIENGMVEITIPQGFTVLEETLSKLVTEKKIEKYEYNYTKINLYLKNTKINEELDLNIGYRAMYPGRITGGAVRAYDYYNPDVEGFAIPVEINISK